MRNSVEHVACILYEIGFCIECDEFCGDEIVRCDGEWEEASVELLSLTDETVVGAVLDCGAIGGDVETAAVGFKEVCLES